MTDIKTTRRNGIIFNYRNKEEFERTFKDVFERDEYPLKSSEKSPFIIDCGAHIGITILFFKKLYTEARILAFEPNPKTFELLNLNIRQNNLKNVELVNAAVSNQNGLSNFHIENKDLDAPSWGDSLAINTWFDPKKGKEITVKTLKLSEYIKEPLELIKLDVEGTEEKVIREIEPQMTMVKNIFIEFHGSSTNSNNDELKIIKILKRNNFRVKVNQGWKIIPEEKITRPDPYWLSLYASK